MEKINRFQKEFMESLSAIQEETVQIALLQKENKSLESDYYQITGEVIVRMMELFDGYRNQNIGELKVYCEQLDEQLKESPCLELHDAVCEYLKFDGE